MIYDGKQLARLPIFSGRMILMNEENRQSQSPVQRGRLQRYVPLVLWMALIFFASTGEFSASNTNALIQPLLRWFFPHITEERIQFFHFLLRKSGHFSEYAVLGVLAAYAFSAATHAGLRRHWLGAALLLICLYALLDEYHQSFVPSRTSSIYDSMIDIAGGLTALVLIALWYRRRRRDRLANRESEIAPTELRGQPLERS